MIVVGCIAAMMTLEWVIARRPRRRQHDVHEITLPATAVPDSATMISFSDAEAAIIEQRLKGLLSRTDYRDTLTALADAEERLSGSNPLDQLMPSRESVDGLAVALPSIPRTTLSAAVALAHHGSGVDGLMRLLGLTDAQALRIVTTADRS